MRPTSDLIALSFSFIQPSPTSCLSSSLRLAPALEHAPQLALTDTEGGSDLLPGPAFREEAQALAHGLRVMPEHFLPIFRDLLGSKGMIRVAARQGNVAP